MTLNRISLLALAVASLMVVACGDDDGGTPDATAPMGDAAPPTGDAAPPGDATPIGDAAPAACHDPATVLDLTVTDACQNADDMANTPDDYGDVTATCARECFLGGDTSADCVVACLRNETECVVSSECTTCYALSSGCAAMNCLSDCLSPTTEAECLACRCGDNAAGVNCFDVFDTCSGGEPATSCDDVPMPGDGAG